MTNTTAPRYVGTLTTEHGEVLSVTPCTCDHCFDQPEWTHEHADLLVRRDSDGGLVRLTSVRFASFTGRP